MDLKTIEDVLKRARKTPFRTGLLLLALAVATASVAWLIAYSSEKGKTAASFVAARNASPQGPAPPIRNDAAVSIDQLTVGTSNNASRVELSLRNPHADQALIRTVSIDARLPGNENMRCQMSINDIIELSEEVTVGVSGRRHELSGSFQLRSDRSFRYPVRGEFFHICGGGVGMRLVMRTALALHGRSLSRLDIVFPRNMKIESNPLLRALGITKANREAFPLDFSVFTEFTATVVTSQDELARSTYVREVPPAPARRPRPDRR